MISVPAGHALPADPAHSAAYDSIAEGYTAENETSLVNAYYERPAMLELAGDVTGRRILDAGCGSGPLFAALRDRGAMVTGIDSSAAMLEQARRRLGAAADLRVADLASPLRFPDCTFDDVVASLVLHYLKDWGPALAELRRVLTLVADSSSRSTIRPRSTSPIAWQGARPATSRLVNEPKNGPWVGRPPSSPSGTGRCTR